MFVSPTQTRLQISASRDDGTQPISVDLTYSVPITEHRHLGGTPRDYFDSNPAPGADQVSCKDGQCANLPQEVWDTLPVQTPDGKPVMRAITDHLSDAPRSPLLHGLTSGLGFGIGGAIVGGLAGALLGGNSMACAIGGAVTAGIVGGGLAAHAVQGDRIRLVWDTYDITTEHLNGYHEAVEPGTMDGQKGYFHRFSPVLQSENLGSYKTPRIEHFKDVKS